MPGGETKVWRRFARISTGGEACFDLRGDAPSSECALSCGDGGESSRGAVGWRMMPTPNLLAEPSRPIATGIVVSVVSVVSRQVRDET